MKIKLAAALLLSLAAASAACAADPKSSPRGNTNRACFYANDVDGFAAQNDRIVNVRVGVNDVYQFELFAPCPDVRWNETLGLQTRGGSNFICSGLDAEIISRTPIGPQRCPVTSIRKLTPQEISALPKGARP